MVTCTSTHIECENDVVHELLCKFVLPHTSVIIIASMAVHTAPLTFWEDDGTSTQLICTIEYNVGWTCHMITAWHVPGAVLYIYPSILAMGFSAWPATMIAIAMIIVP